jgi:hypothetical protein
VLEALDFTTQAAQLEGPVYFFAGRNAVNAMSSLVEGYYDLLQAPHKELIWLEGGHGRMAKTWASLWRSWCMRCWPKPGLTRNGRTAPFA